MQQGIQLLTITTHILFDFPNLRHHVSVCIQQFFKYTHMYICIFVHLYTIYKCIYIIVLSIYLPIFMFPCLRIGLFYFMSICMYIHIHIYQSIPLKKNTLLPNVSISI